MVLEKSAGGRELRSSARPTLDDRPLGSHRRNMSEDAGSGLWWLIFWCCLLVGSFVLCMSLSLAREARCKIGAGTPCSIQRRCSPLIARRVC